MVDDQTSYSAIRLQVLVKGQHPAQTSVLKVESTLPSSSNIINQLKSHVQNQSRSSVLWLHMNIGMNISNSTKPNT